MLILTKYLSLHGRTKLYRRQCWTVHIHFRKILRKPDIHIFVPNMTLVELRQFLRKEYPGKSTKTVDFWGGPYLNLATTTNGHTYRVIGTSFEPQPLCADSLVLNRLQLLPIKQLRKLAHSLQVPRRTQLTKQNLIFAIGIFLQENSLQLPPHLIE